MGQQAQSEEPGSQKLIAGGQPAVINLIEPVETIEGQGQCQDHDAVVLHHPREAEGDPLDGQQGPGQASYPPVEHAASQEESGQHGQGAGQSEGATQGELVEAVSE